MFCIQVTSRKPKYEKGMDSWMYHQYKHVSGYGISQRDNF